MRDQRDELDKGSQPTLLPSEKSKANCGSLEHNSPQPRHSIFPSPPTCEASLEQIGICWLYATLILQPCPIPLLAESLSQVGKTISIEPSRSGSSALASSERHSHSLMSAKDKGPLPFGRSYVLASE